MKKLNVILTILLFAVLALASCTQNTNQELSQPEYTTTPEPQEVQSQSVVTPKGTVTDMNKVTNEVGGYFIPIPNSWVGKTSYELYEDETYIYHITTDIKENEINPTILHVGAAYDVEPTNLYASAEVFLQMDDVKFYNVPVLDFPYTQGNEDDNEYKGFISDIPLILQSICVIDESKWQQEIHLQNDNTIMEYPDSSGKPFFSLDATIDGIPLGTDKDTTIDSLTTGSYLENIEEYVLGATGEKVEEYIFGFGTLTFTEDIFTGAFIHSSVSGPRGFGIGDNIVKIKEYFCPPYEYSKDGYTIYYRANKGDEDTSVVVPPSCVSYNSGDDKRFVLSCFDHLQNVDLEYLRYNYMYETQYICTFYFDENGIVDGFAMHYGATAE